MKAALFVLRFNEFLACGFFQWGLTLQDADFLEPVLDERRPRRNRMLLAPQAEGVPAPGEEMDLCRDARIIKGCIAGIAFTSIIHTSIYLSL